MGYRLSKAAAQDIATIFRQGASKFGIAQAEKYHTGLEKIFAFLAANPNAVHERAEFTPPVRIHPFGVHVVIYRIAGSDILILRVPHGRQNWERWL